MDRSLESDMRTFGGTQYLPLERLCDAHGLIYSRDTFAGKSTVSSSSGTIIMRDGSSAALVDGALKNTGQPVIVRSDTVYVPASFARSAFAIPSPAPAKEERAAPVERVQRTGRFTIKTIVLDPGHGGKDVGAVGKRLHLREKKLALDLARKIRKILERNGVTVIMTRDDDRFIALQKRADIANRASADLFVAVHINASRSRSLRGFECYFLSNATDDNARAVEAFENASLGLGQTASAERSKQLDKTLWDMQLSENRAESAQVAAYICDSVDRSNVIDSRGVKSARFYVLKKTRMPAVLVEAGYISNRYEEAKVNAPGFLDKMAQAVAAGILKYKDEYERTEGFTRG